MTLGLEEEIKSKKASRVTYRATDEDTRIIPVNAGWPENDRSMGETFMVDHPDRPEKIEMKITDRTHSENFILGELEKGLPFKDLCVLAVRRLRSFFNLLFPFSTLTI